MDNLDLIGHKSIQFENLKDDDIVQRGDLIIYGKSDSASRHFVMGYGETPTTKATVMKEMKAVDVVRPVSTGDSNSLLMLELALTELDWAWANLLPAVENKAELRMHRETSKKLIENPEYGIKDPEFEARKTDETNT